MPSHKFKSASAGQIIRATALLLTSAFSAHTQTASVVYTGPAATDKFESLHAGAALVKLDKTGATYHYNKGLSRRRT